MQLNDLSNCVILPIALSDSNRISTFYSNGQYDEMASLIDQLDTSKSTLLKSHVQARIGDEVLQELNVHDICAIKIDVEGAELSVLNGLQKTIKIKQPPIIFEILPNFYGISERKSHLHDVCVRNQASADAIFNFLNKMSYDVFQINDSNGLEAKVHRFELDDQSTFLGSNFIAHARNNS